MQSKTCACPNCPATLNDKAVESQGSSYCCQACADHHSHGENCAMVGCHCGDSAMKHSKQD